MAKDFRKTVFELCNKISRRQESLEIRELVHNISVTVQSEEDDPTEIKRPPHGDLSYVASRQRIQFLGYLLADESVDQINKQQPFIATHLEKNERELIEKAHKTINFFISSCLKELNDRYPKSSFLTDPYIEYRVPTYKSNAISFLTDADVRECVEAFKKGKLYRKLIENDTLIPLERVDENILRQLAAIQKKQYIKDIESVSKETEELKNKLRNNTDITVVELLAVYTTYCYALREALSEAAQMLYEAILGYDMAVMNNDNLISVSGPNNDAVYEKYTALVQSAFYGIRGGDIGSITLLTCDRSENEHIKEFGSIVSLSVSFSAELGNTSKVTIVTVDDELNPIHNLTDFILETKLGSSPVEYGENLVDK